MHTILNYPRLSPYEDKNNSVKVIDDGYYIDIPQELVSDALLRLKRGPQVLQCTTISIGSVAFWSCDEYI